MLFFISRIFPGEFFVFFIAMLRVILVYVMVVFTLSVLPGTGCGTPLRKSLAEV